MIKPKSEPNCCDRLVVTNYDELKNYENENGCEKSFVKNDSEKQRSILVSNNQFQIDDDFSDLEEKHFDFYIFLLDKNNQYNEDDDIVNKICEKLFAKNDSEDHSLHVSNNQFQIDDDFWYIEEVRKLGDLDLNIIVFDKNGTNKENNISLEEEKKNNQYNEDDDIVYKKYYLYISSKTKNKFLSFVEPNKKSCKPAQQKGKSNNLLNPRKFLDDLINKKLKVNYSNFYIDLINYFLREKENTDLKFLHLEPEIKNEVTKSIIKEMKDPNLKFEDVINKEKRNDNKKILEIIKQKNLTDIIELLNKPFLFLFDKIYYTKRKTNYNLKDLGLKAFVFYLPKNIEFYEDLLAKNEKTDNFKEYHEKMEICCRKNFLPGKPTFIIRKRNRKEKRIKLKLDKD